MGAKKSGVRFGLGNQKEPPRTESAGTFRISRMSATGIVSSISPLANRIESGPISTMRPIRVEPLASPSTWSSSAPGTDRSRGARDGSRSWACTGERNRARPQHRRRSPREPGNPPETDAVPRHPHPLPSAGAAGAAPDDPGSLRVLPPGLARTPAGAPRSYGRRCSPGTLDAPSAAGSATVEDLEIVRGVLHQDGSPRGQGVGVPGGNALRPLPFDRQGHGSAADETEEDLPVVAGRRDRRPGQRPGHLDAGHAPGRFADPGVPNLEARAPSGPPGRLRLPVVDERRARELPFRPEVRRGQLHFVIHRGQVFRRHPDLDDFQAVGGLEHPVTDLRGLDHAVSGAQDERRALVLVHHPDPAPVAEDELEADRVVVDLVVHRSPFRDPDVGGDHGASEAVGEEIPVEHPRPAHGEGIVAQEAVNHEFAGGPRDDEGRVRGFHDKPVAARGDEAPGPVGKALPGVHHEMQRHRRGRRVPFQPERRPVPGERGDRRTVGGPDPVQSETEHLGEEPQVFPETGSRHPNLGPADEMRPGLAGARRRGCSRHGGSFLAPEAIAAPEHRKDGSEIPAPGKVPLPRGESRRGTAALGFRAPAETDPELEREVTTAPPEVTTAPPEVTSARGQSDPTSRGRVTSAQARK